MRILFNIFGLWAVIGVAWAESLSHIFPEHRTIFESKPHTSEYLLSLGALKKVNGNWISANEIKLEGELSRATFEMNRSVSVDDAWSALLLATQAHKSKTLFACEGLDCGSSNAWANNRFEIKQLYGLDQSQRYRVFQDSVAGAARYTVLYMVQRGNRRVYAQVDRILDFTQDHRVLSVEDIIKNVYSHGYFIVPGDAKRDALSISDLIFSEATLHLLVKALEELSNENIALVVHGTSQKTGSKAAVHEASQKFAHSIVDLLNKAGLPHSQKLTVFGAGPYLPREGSPTNRVELVLLR